MIELDANVQTQWTAFEQKWEQKILEPDSKEGTIIVLEHRIRISVQTEIEKIWKGTSTRLCTHRWND